MHRSKPRSATTALATLALLASGLVAAEPAGADLASSHTFAGWTQRIQGQTDATFVADESTAVDGEASLRIDNGTARGPNLYAELYQDVPVTTGATYEMSGWFRGQELPESAAVLVTSNDWNERIPLPQGTFDWQEITWEITIPAGETVRSWRVLLEDVGSLWIDDLSMVAPGTTQNLLTNASFEDFSAGPETPAIGVPTEALVFSPGAANIPVTSTSAELTYEITDVDGVMVQQGSLDTSTGSTTLDAAALEPGYYGLRLESTAIDATVLDTSFAIVAELPGSTRGPQSSFGISYHPNEFRTRSELTANLGQIGASYGRIDYPWSQVELEPGVYTFPAYLEEQVQGQIANGIRPLLILNYRNRFYDDNRTPSTPEGLAGWGNYAAAVADHFGTAVDYEIYNEPNHHFNDGLCGRTAECYYDLMVAATDRIREVLPEATIAGPAIVNDLDWLTRFAQLGGLEHIDALSFHTYNHPENPDVFQPEMIAAGVELVDEYAEPGHDVEVWITEVGWPVRDGYVSEHEQATYIPRYMAAAIAAGADRSYWYEITDGGTDPADLEQVFGMMRHYTPEVPAYAPRPGYIAYVEAVRHLANAEFVARDNLAEGAFGFAFNGGAAGPVRVLWASEAQDVTVTAAEVLTVVDVFGRQSQIGPGEVALSLTDRPVYLLGGVDEVASAPESVYSSTAPAVIDLDTPVTIDVAVDHRGHTGEVDGPVTFRASTGERILVPARTGELTTETLTLLSTGAPGVREITVDVVVGGEVVMQQRHTVTVADHRSTYKLEPVFSDIADLDASVGVTITNASDAADLHVTNVTWEVEGTTVEADATTATVPLGSSTTLTARLPEAELWRGYPVTVTITYADGVVRTLSSSLAYNPVLREDAAPEHVVDLGEVGTEVVLTEPSTGPADLSGTARLSRTDTGVVLVASVNDDVHDNTVSPGNMWQADSIQMAFSPVLPAQASSYVELGAGLGPDGAAVQLFSGAGGPVTQAEVSIEHHAGVTDYRVELPWSVIGVSPDARTFGFSMLINDADGDGRTTFLEWGSGIGISKVPSQYQPMRVLEVAAPEQPQPAQVGANATSSVKGQRATVAVYARNDDTAAVDIRFTLPSGETVKFDDVAPGSAVYHRFTVGCELPAGSVSVATYVERESGPAHHVLQAPYEATTCPGGGRR